MCVWAWTQLVFRQLRKEREVEMDVTRKNMERLRNEKKDDEKREVPLLWCCVSCVMCGVWCVMCGVWCVVCGV